MPKEELFEKIHLEVLQKIRPIKKEQDSLKEVCQTIVQQLSLILKEEHITAKLEVAGSFSRDTWLAGTRDIDLFVILPYESTLSPKQLLKIIEERLPLPWEKRHAQHPYLFTQFQEVKIEIVPCYEFQPDRPLRSPVDRSPQHKKFLLERLPVGANDEVRLLKQFMKGIGVYGAETKVHGFSGYLVELLILYYHGYFLEVLRNAPKLLKEIITFHSQLSITREDFPDDTLIVIDPIDKHRNVASAVKKETLIAFIAAAVRYLNHPSLSYFFPPPVEKCLSDQSFLPFLQKHPLPFVAIIYPRPQVVSDILWGQIKKFEHSLTKYLKRNGFQLINIDSLVIDKYIYTFVLTLQVFSSSTRWVLGPPIAVNNAEDFFKRYRKSPETLFGPIPLDKHWKVLVRQEEKRVDKSIKEALAKKTVAIPSYLELTKSRVVFKEAFLDEMKEKKELLAFLVKLVNGKPLYLC